MHRFFLDNTLVENGPMNASSLSERMYYSELLYSNLSEINGTIEFYGTEYDYIYDAWVVDSCSSIDLIIEKYNVTTCVWDLEFKGFIFLSDVTFDDDRRRVNCEIIDNSFIAMIDNNKAIQMHTDIQLSKNLVDISSFYSLTTGVNVFTYTGGGGTYANRSGIMCYDAFAALIAFMTDGLCEFDSVFFSDPVGTYTEGNQYMLLTGLAVRGNTTDYPVISFEELYTDLRRAYNLRIGIEVSQSGSPLIRIEPKEYFRSTNHYDLSDLKNIKFSRKEGNQFTQILVGNELSDQINTNNLFDYIWNTYKSKDYYLGGQCNKAELKLDLTFETICPDVIVIEAVQNLIADEDDRIFIIAIQYWNFGQDEYWNPFDIYNPPIIYNNKSLRNGEIIERWEDDIFSAVSLLDYFVYDFKAELTSPQTMGAFEDIIFDNDSTNGNYDNGGNYNNATGLYTCLVTGTYRVRFTVEMLSTGGSSTFDIGIAASLAGGPQNLYWYYPGVNISTPQTLLTGESFTYVLEHEFPVLEGTDPPVALFDAIMSIQVDKSAGAGTLTAESGTFEVFTPASGIFRNFSANEVYSKEITAEGGIDSITWANMKANRDYKLRVQGVNTIHECYGIDIERNLETGKVTFKGLGKP